MKPMNPVNRMNRRLVLALCLLAFGLLGGLVACKSVTSGVKWEPKPDIPDLGNRGGGCYVELYEVGREPDRPYKIVGTMVLDLNRDQMKAGGGADVAKRFKESACEYGVFLIKDVKTYPEPTSGRMLYEAKAAVWIDENGDPILQQSQKDEEPGDEAAGDDVAAEAEPSEATPSAADAGSIS